MSFHVEGFHENTSFKKKLLSFPLPAWRGVTRTSDTSSTHIFFTWLYPLESYLQTSLARISVVLHQLAHRLVYRRSSDHSDACAWWRRGRQGLTHASAFSSCGNGNVWQWGTPRTLGRPTTRGPIGTLPSSRSRPLDRDSRNGRP